MQESESPAVRAFCVKKYSISTLLEDGKLETEATIDTEGTEFLEGTDRKRIMKHLLFVLSGPSRLLQGLLCQKLLYLYAPRGWEIRD